MTRVNPDFTYNRAAIMQSAWMAHRDCQPACRKESFGFSLKCAWSGARTDMRKAVEKAALDMSDADRIERIAQIDDDLNQSRYLPFGISQAATVNRLRREREMLT